METRITELKTSAGYSVADIMTRYRIGKDKAMKLIRGGMLRAIDTGRGVGRCQFRVPPEAITEFENRLAVKPATAARRQRKDSGESPTVAAFLDAD